MQGKNDAGDAGEVIKRCGCGRTYTPEQWATLRLLGLCEPLPEAITTLELRNCVCGSSMGVPVPVPETEVHQ